MGRGKWAMLLAVVVVLVVVPFAWWVWPTAWRYDHWNQRPVRTHRVTGRYEVMVAGGWLPVGPPSGEEAFLARNRARMTPEEALLSRLRARHAEEGREPTSATE